MIKVVVKEQKINENKNYEKETVNEENKILEKNNPYNSNGELLYYVNTIVN